MANTASPGRIAPASKPATGTPRTTDLVALHGEAINACAMATYYARKGNHAGAARKSVQALTALRRLQSAPINAPASPCTDCRDNFPLPQALDVFDRKVIAGYVERRTACDKCPAGAKPCMTTKGA